MKNVLIIIMLGIAYSLPAQQVVTSERVPIKMIKSKSEESLPLLSNDRKRLYFTRSFDRKNEGGATAGQDIWFCEKDSNGEWQEPINLRMLNNKKNNAVIGVGSERLYVLNSYDDKKDNTQQGIIVFKQSDGLWKEVGEIPINIECNGPFVDYYISPEETLVMISCQGEETIGEEDLYVFIKEKEKWSAQTSLGGVINTQKAEISPFLTEGGKKLFFASNGHEGYGNMDLFVSERLDDGWENWSTPINLGEIINSRKFEAYLSIYEDTAYFSSSAGRGYADIYTSIVKVFDKDTLPVYDTMPMIAETFIDTGIIDISMPVMEKIVVEESFYLVQLLALYTPDVPKRSFFKDLNINKISMFEGKDGLNRFSYGKFDTFREAKEYMIALRDEGYTDAFVRSIDKYSELSVPKDGSLIISYSE